MNNDLRLALQAMKEVYPTIQEIKTTEMVIAFMGLLLDQYCADHKVSESQKIHLLMGLVDASMFVNNVLEPLVPTEIKDAE
jgi:hypothetical protein